MTMEDIVRLRMKPGLKKPARRKETPRRPERQKGNRERSHKRSQQFPDMLTHSLVLGAYIAF